MEAAVVHDTACLHRELNDTAWFHFEQDAKTIMDHKGGDGWGVDGARCERGKVARTTMLVRANMTSCLALGL
jgi:hypothetical protein